jgi:hypothetical protein
MHLTSAKHVTCPARVVQQVKQLIKTKLFISALAAAPRLTLDHAVALWLYTCESPLYRTLNRLLRARNRAELMAGFFPYLRLLLEAFAGLASPKPRMVNRGVALDLVAANPDLYVKGGELTWWGFSSTTTDIAVLKVRRNLPIATGFDAVNGALGCLAAEPDVPRLDRRPHDLPDPDAPRHRH